MPHSIYVQLLILPYKVIMVHFRYYLMQKAKAATTVGILVGTLATGSDIIIIYHIIIIIIHRWL